VLERTNLVKIEFLKSYRQVDNVFLNILEDVRMNKLSNNDIKMLNERIGYPKKEDGIVITLTSRNDVADNINKKQLSRPI